MNRKLKKIPTQKYDSQYFEQDSDLEDIPCEDLDEDIWAPPYEPDTVVRIYPALTNIYHI